MSTKHLKTSVKHNKGKLSKTDARRAKRIKSQVIASTQNTLAYEWLAENGIMKLSNADNRYSRSFRLGSTSYITATKDNKKDIISNYNDAINSLSEDESFQLTLLITKTNEKQFMQEHFMPLANDAWDSLRSEYNQMIASNYRKGYSNLNVERYITLSTSATDEEKALAKFDNLETLMGGNLSAVDVDFKALDGIERLRMMNDITRPHSPLAGDFEDVWKLGLTTKDLIAPSSIKFNRDKFDLGERKQKIIYLRDFPQELSDGLFKDLTECGLELVVTIHAKPYSIADTNKRLNNQATSVDSDIVSQQMKAAQAGYSGNLISRSAMATKKDLDEVIEFVRETGDKQFSSIFLISVSGEDEAELLENLAVVKGVGAKYGAVFDSLEYVQEEAFNSILPIGQNFTDVERSFQRDLITPNLSINSPFTGVDLQHKKGRYFGINLLSRNLIYLDRQDASLDNSNLLIAGASGSGKSVTSKNEMISTYLSHPKDEFIVVSPENEYDGVALAVDGEVVRIAPKSNTRINIMDLPDQKMMNKEDDPVAIKSNSLISLFKSLFPSLTENQESLIDDVTIKCYEQYQAPDLTNWYAVLNTYETASARDLSEKLSMYITGSLDIFAHETNVNLSSRFVVYNINQMQGKLETFGFLAVIDNVWKKIIENKARGIQTWVYFDEMQVLLSGEQSDSIRVAFQDIWSRIRKYGGNPTGITQSIETVLSSPEGRAMFQNSELLILLKQKPLVYDMLVEIMNLTEQEARFLKNPEKGSGLLVAGNTIIPFANPIPHETKLYKIMQTDVA